MWIYLYAFSFVTFFLCFLGTDFSNNAARNGVYSRPGRWFSLKFLIFYALLKLRKVSKSYYWLQAATCACETVEKYAISGGKKAKFRDQLQKLKFFLFNTRGGIFQKWYVYQFN